MANMVPDLTKMPHIYANNNHCDGISVYWNEPTLESPERVAVIKHLPSIERAKQNLAWRGFKEAIVHNS